MSWEQFQNYFQYSPAARENDIPSDKNEVRTASYPVQKETKDLAVTQKLEQVEAEKGNLLKVNNNLETNLQKYAIMLSDEKTEKQLWIDKYNETNGKYIEKIEEASQDKIRYSSVVFGLLTLIGMIAVAAGLIYYFNVHSI
ncbi:MAG: hypothetical protein JWQ09_3564 [Segetibacter sp.]|nr:hypothetical protein [Segetibacter sp.]